MLLYKNVDIVDLNSIIKRGILSLDDCGNDNWENGTRSKNATDVVYLFKPLENQQNSFVNYGVALVEVDISENDVVKCEIGERDVNKGLYEEYVVKEVPVSNIKTIYIPEIFKNPIKDELKRRCESCLNNEVLEKIEYCGATATHYTDSSGCSRVSCSSKDLEQFAKTARSLIDSSNFNYFRGENEDGTVEDIYDIQYIF